MAKTSGVVRSRSTRVMAQVTGAATVPGLLFAGGGILLAREGRGRAQLSVRGRATLARPTKGRALLGAGSDAALVEPTLGQALLDAGGGTPLAGSTILDNRGEMRRGGATGTKFVTKSGQNTGRILQGQKVAGAGEKGWKVEVEVKLSKAARPMRGRPYKGMECWPGGGLRQRWPPQ